jgi:hypothetical protein
VNGGVDQTNSAVEDVGKRCMREYGYLRGKDSQYGGHTGIEHWKNCRNDEVFDFLEMLFQSKRYLAQQIGVDAVNGVLREEGIGFSFTDYITEEVAVDKVYPQASPAMIQLMKLAAQTRATVKYPQAIKLTNLHQHQNVVIPALRFLTDPRFENADREMLAAHAHYRAGDYGAAMNACGQAFESTLKAILTGKKWAYDKDKDTLSKLVDIGREKGLFPAFYTEIFKNAGTLRNKFGSHGGAEHGVPEAHHASHLIGLVSAHILVLAKFANL